MPRAILSALVGAGLAVAGTATIATTISLRVSQPMFAGARAGHAAPSRRSAWWSTYPDLVSEWYLNVVAMTLRLTDDEKAMLHAQAKREGASMQEVVKRAIVARAAQWAHGERVAESSDRMLAQWADVLDDLAKS